MDVKMFAAKCFHIGLTVFSEDKVIAHNQWYGGHKQRQVMHDPSVLL